MKLQNHTTIRQASRIKILSTNTFSIYLKTHKLPYNNIDLRNDVNDHQQQSTRVHYPQLPA